MIREVVFYLLTLPFRLYYTTWCFILILFKRKVPKWLQKRVEEEIKYEPVWGKPVEYRR